MTQEQILTALREQADRGQLNAAEMLRMYSTTTPQERLARRKAAVERFRQRVAS